MKISKEQVEEGLRKLENWALADDKTMVRDYTFPSIMEAIRFVQTIAGIAETMNHHPSITIDYRKVTIRLTTWSVGGLSALDLESARKYDLAHKAAERPE